MGRTWGRRRGTACRSDSTAADSGPLGTAIGGGERVATSKPVRFGLLLLPLLKLQFCQGRITGMS